MSHRQFDAFGQNPQILRSLNNRSPVLDRSVPQNVVALRGQESNGHVARSSSTSNNRGNGNYRSKSRNPNESYHSGQGPSNYNQNAYNAERSFVDTRSASQGRRHYNNGNRGGNNQQFNLNKSMGANYEGNGNRKGRSKSKGPKNGHHRQQSMNRTMYAGSREEAIIQQQRHGQYQRGSQQQEVYHVRGGQNAQINGVQQEYHHPGQRDRSMGARYNQNKSFGGYLENQQNVNQGNARGQSGSVQQPGRSQNLNKSFAGNNGQRAQAAIPSNSQNPQRVNGVPNGQNGVKCHQNNQGNNYTGKRHRSKKRLNVPNNSNDQNKSFGGYLTGAQPDSTQSDSRGRMDSVPLSHRSPSLNKTFAGHTSSQAKVFIQPTEQDIPVEQKENIPVAHHPRSQFSCPRQSEIDRVNSRISDRSSESNNTVEQILCQNPASEDELCEELAGFSVTGIVKMSPMVSVRPPISSIIRSPRAKSLAFPKGRLELAREQAAEVQKTETSLGGSTSSANCCHPPIAPNNVPSKPDSVSPSSQASSKSDVSLSKVIVKKPYNSGWKYCAMIRHGVVVDSEPDSDFVGVYIARNVEYPFPDIVVDAEGTASFVYQGTTLVMVMPPTFAFILIPNNAKLIEGVFVAGRYSYEERPDGDFGSLYTVYNLSSELLDPNLMKPRKKLDRKTAAQMVSEGSSFGSDSTASIIPPQEQAASSQATTSSTLPPIEESPRGVSTKRPLLLPPQVKGGHKPGTLPKYRHADDIWDADIRPPKHLQLKDGFRMRSAPPPSSRPLSDLPVPEKPFGFK